MTAEGRPYEVDMRLRLRQFGAGCGPRSCFVTSHRSIRTWELHGPHTLRASFPDPRFEPKLSRLPIRDALIGPSIPPRSWPMRVRVESGGTDSRP